MRTEGEEEKEEEEKGNIHGAGENNKHHVRE